jgi:uncharacterized membrane protein YvbJ
MTPEICPNCGAEVPRNAKACPECGSDEQTGWSEETNADGLGLTEEKFDYDDYVKREFGAKQVLPHGVSWFWWAIGILILAAFIFLLVR